jgi:hypothetical protein
MSDQISCTINTMYSTQTHTPYQRANREQLEVNGKLFVVVRKGNIFVKVKLKKIKKTFRKKPSN